jgi:hypothetical protein
MIPFRTYLLSTAPPVAGGGGSGGGGAGSDPHFSNVVYLLQADQGAVDQSSYARPVTLVGPTSVVTGVAKFGTKSFRLNGNGAAITTPVAPEFYLTPGPFTAEAWFNFDDVSGFRRIMGVGGDTFTGFDNQTHMAGGNNWYMVLEGGSLILYVTNNLGIRRVGSGFTPTPGQWYHLAVSNTGGSDVRWYVDGAVVFSEAQTAPPAGAEFRIGPDFSGNVDQVRVSNGYARYDATPFTPPTAPFPKHS